MTALRLVERKLRVKEAFMKPTGTPRAGTLIIKACSSLPVKLLHIFRHNETESSVANRSLPSNPRKIFQPLVNKSCAAFVCTSST